MASTTEPSTAICGTKPANIEGPASAAAEAAAAASSGARTVRSTSKQ